MEGTIGRPVYVADIAVYAKKGCSSCYGQGFLIRHQNGQKNYIPCGCAARRFNSVCKKDILIDGTELRWKLGKAPPLYEQGSKSNVAGSQVCRTNDEAEARDS